MEKTNETNKTKTNKATEPIENGQPNPADRDEVEHVSAYGTWYSKTRQAVSLFYRKAMNDDLFERASGLAFQALFSLIPMVAVAYFLFALVGGLEKLQAQVENYAVQYLAPSAADQVTAYLQTIRGKVSPGAIGIFGVLGFIWAGISMISKAEAALNAIWGLKRTRTLQQRVILYSFAVISAPLVLGISLAITSVMTALVNGPGVIGQAGIVVLILAPVFLTGSFLALIYWLLPYTSVSVRASIFAGLATAAVLELLKQGYTWYATYSLGNSIYGSLAILPILFLWFSLSATVFMLGGELCYFLDARRSGFVRVASDDSHLSFPLLVDILRFYQRMNGIVSVRRVVSDLRWDQSQIYRHVDYLVRLKLLRAPGNNWAGEECYEAVERDFEPALRKLLESVNRVKYEHLEFAAVEVDQAAEVSPTGVGATRAPAYTDKQHDEMGPMQTQRSELTETDRVWSPWGAVRRP